MSQIDAMSFCNSGTFKETLVLADAFAGNGGRIATMKDIALCRIGNLQKFFWGRYFTTLSSEFYGLYRNEKPMIVVAHGIGPLSTIEGILEAYETNADDERGPGRVPQNVFDDLVEGKFGEVHLVDIGPILDEENQFANIRKVDREKNRGLYDNGYFTAKALIANPLFIARMGSKEIAEAYLKTHEQLARSEILARGFHSEKEIDEANMYICDVELPLNCRYYTFAGNSLQKIPMIEKFKNSGMAHANLLCFDQLMLTNVYSERVDQLVTSIGIYETGHSYRFLGIKDNADFANAREFSFANLVKKRVPSLFVEKAETKPQKLVALTNLDNTFYTQVPKEGDSMDTGKIEAEVIEFTKIGDPVLIVLKNENMFFLRYDISEVEAVMPEEANAYEMISYDDRRGASITVQFYKINADAKQIMDENSLAADPIRMMKAIQEAA